MLLRDLMESRGHTDENVDHCIDQFLEAIEVDMKKGRRKTRQPAPEGGISISAASCKYNIATSTITQWMKAGWIKIMRRDPNWTYIQESEIKEIAGVHHSTGGHGTRAISRYIKNKRER